MALASLLAPLLLSLAALADAPLTVVVTAEPPVDAERLAAAVRAYLDEHGIEVQVRGVEAGAAGDLRRQLAEARRIGEAVRALAVMRASAGAAGQIEIELVDLATEKALVAEVARPPRDEDLYRTLALKIQALLRATLSEAPERLAATPPLLELIAPSPPPPPAAGSRRLALETGYTLLAFPLAPLTLQGLAVTVAFAPRPWLELALGSAALTSGRAEGRDVVAIATVVPVSASARLRLRRGRVELLLGPGVQVAYVGVSPSSSTSDVRAVHDVVPAAGLDGEARLRFGAGAWLFARAAALAVLVGEAYRVEGQVIMDTSRLQVTASAGVGVGLW